MLTNVNKLLIYSNSKTFGGVEIIVSRFVDYLINRGVDVRVIEGKDTKLAELLDQKNCITIEESKEYDYDLVFFPNFCKILDREVLELSKECLIYSWVVHPNELFTSFFVEMRKTFRILGYRSAFLQRVLFFKKFRRIQNLIKRNISKQALCFMDGACVRATNYFYPSVTLDEKKIIPVPISSILEDNLKAENIKNKNVNKFGYLGRMDKMKYSALSGIISKYLSKIPNAEFHFVGTGDLVNKLEKKCNDNNVIFIDYGFQHNFKAKKILKEKTQVCFAMGISALDLATSGIPCLMIDPSISMLAKSQSKFKPISEIVDFSLGEYRDFPMYKERGYSFDEAIVKVTSQSVIKSSRNYVIDNHAPNVVFEALFESMTKSEQLLGEAIDELY